MEFLVYVFWFIVVAALGIIVFVIFGGLLMGNDQVKAGMLLGDEFDRNQ